MQLIMHELFHSNMYVWNIWISVGGKFSISLNECRRTGCWRFAILLGSITSFCTVFYALRISSHQPKPPPSPVRTASTEPDDSTILALITFAQLSVIDGRTHASNINMDIISVILLTV